MQILLASAKLMRESSAETGLPLSRPRFQDQAESFARELGRFSVEHLGELFSCSGKIAALNKSRFQIFGTDEAELMPAILAYNGQAYKHLRVDIMTREDLLWANAHLFISSCMYGLLRPLDVINQYRMDGSFALAACGDKADSAPVRKVNEFWRPLLTDVLIEEVRRDDGVLLYLDTEEFRSLFDWKRVSGELHIIEPSFHIAKTDSSSGALRLTTPSVWAKTCRGAMARYVICERISNPALLEAFSYEGFGFDSGLSTEGHPVFVRKQEAF